MLLDLPARGPSASAVAIPGCGAACAQRQPGQIGAGDQQDEAGSQHQGQYLRTQRLGLAFLERYRVVGTCALGLFFSKRWHAGPRRG